MSLRKAFAHFRTITRHRHTVIAHCRRAGILRQGLLHDLSKYAPTEFRAGARYYAGTRSPNELEREQHGYSAAWLHHKGRNRHHFEYWMDYDPVTRTQQPVKMPLRYVIEMFCDRVAASKIYRGRAYDRCHPLEYFERGIKTRVIHPETSAFLHMLLRMLAERGEDETFRYIRQFLRAHRDYTADDCTDEIPPEL